MSRDAVAEQALAAQVLQTLQEADPRELTVGDLSTALDRPGTQHDWSLILGALHRLQDRGQVEVSFTKLAAFYRCTVPTVTVTPINLEASHG